MQSHLLLQKEKMPRLSGTRVLSVLNFTYCVNKVALEKEVLVLRAYLFKQMTSFLKKREELFFLIKRDNFVVSSPHTKVWFQETAVCSTSPTK